MGNLLGHVVCQLREEVLAGKGNADASEHGKNRGYKKVNDGFDADTANRLDIPER